MAEENGNKQIKVLFLPYFTTSHIIPMVDTARLFAAAHGVAATIVTTAGNARLFQSSVDRDAASGREISVHLVELPSARVGLEEGIENFGQCTTAESMTKLSSAIGLLRDPMERFIRETRPDGIVSDMFFPWTAEIAEEIKVPRILWYVNNAFFHSVWHSLATYAPQHKVDSDTEAFLIPGLPDKIYMTRSQLEHHFMKKTIYGDILDIVKESEVRSYGVLFTSFIEVEPNYAHHYKEVVGRKCWHLGLPSHFIEKYNKDGIEKVKKSVTQRHYCLSWLDAQKPDSVLFVVFGSMVRFPDAQFTEIALALEASGCPFVWVVRKKGEEELEDWLPKGFEERVKESNKGLIIREWAPQALILNHAAIGGFMTHCGWNSASEAILAGVPLITWPLFAEQFYNEQLITRVMGIGVEVGTGVWNESFIIKSPLVGNDKIVRAITCLMGGSMEAEEIRRRAREFGDMANMSMEEGGSSYSDLNGLIEEIKTLAFHKTNFV